MASNQSSLKDLAAKAAKVASNKTAVDKACDDATAAAPHDLDLASLASQLKAAPDAAAIKVICDGVAAR